jgi:YYY domain-containing protein
VLTSVAGVPASTGYNLSLAYTFAAAATAVASLAYAMARWALGSRARNWAYWAGGVAVVMLLGVASLGAVFEWFAAHGHTNAAVFDFFGITWRISCAEQLRDFCYDGPAQRTNAWYPTEFWWWFGLTRTIPGTITEFPFFSFLLGDLHPHVMSIPLVLLVLGLAANAWRGRSELSWRTHLRHPLEGLLIALVLGALAFENAWDLLTFTAVFSVAVVVHDLRRGRPLFTLHDAFGYLGPLFAVAVVAYVPWYAEFTSQASGLYPYVGEGTKPAHAFLQFGPLLLAGLVGLTFTLRARDRQVIATTGVTALWVPLLPLMAWLLYATQQGDLRDAVDARSGGGWVTLGAYGVSTWLFAVAFGVNALKRRAIALPLGLAATGALLFYGAELFYVGDIFKDSVPRLNTVFKLTYQAWILLSAAGAVLLVLAAREALRNRRALAWLWAPVAAAVALGLVYALIALPNRTDGFDKETATDGLAFVARNDPPEYALTRWVQDHTGPGDVIIEASGRTWRRGEDGQPVVVNDGVDYTDAGRISARTGRATAIGWFFHEVQWRGQGEANRAELTRRQDLLDSVYTASSPQVALNAMDRVGARYVVVGRVELSRFPGDLMPKFETFLDVVFESDGLRVYEKPSYTVTHTS